MDTNKNGLIQRVNASQSNNGLQMSRQMPPVTAQDTAPSDLAITILTMIQETTPEDRAYIEKILGQVTRQEKALKTVGDQIDESERNVRKMQHELLEAQKRLASDIEKMGQRPPEIHPLYNNATVTSSLDLSSYASATGSLTSMRVDDSWAVSPNQVFYNEPREMSKEQIQLLMDKMKATVDESMENQFKALFKGD